MYFYTFIVFLFLFRDSPYNYVPNSSTTEVYLGRTEIKTRQYTKESIIFLSDKKIRELDL